MPTTHEYTGGWEFFVGGGVAVLDCDGNGYPDLFAAGGENPATLLKNVSKPGSTLAFLEHRMPAAELTDVIGAYPLDIDADGQLDLFVLRVGENQVLKGRTDCHFERVTDAWRIDDGDQWSTAFAAAWAPGDRWPTLVVGNYVDRHDPSGPFGTCDTHRLFRPETRRYAKPEPLEPGFCSLSMQFVDWSGLGKPDLWVSNDRHYYRGNGREQLFSVWPELRAYTAADGWREQRLWGMGIASRDLSGDGRPEIMVTSMADQKLFALASGPARPTFASESYARGITAHVPYTGGDGRPSTGWHAQFGDVNNDGLDDLFIAKGNVNQMPDAAMRDPNNLLVQRDDGHFVELGESAGVASLDRGRGAALTDLDRDGLLDLVVVNRNAPMAIYRNVTVGAGHWTKLRLQQPGGNRNAVGARIELKAGERRQYRFVQVGGGHAGGQAGHLHFGLGPAATARLRVRWPDGELSEWTSVEANRHYLVKRDGTRLVLTSDYALQFDG